jgi:hypothetical protein
MPRSFVVVLFSVAPGALWTGLANTLANRGKIFHLLAPSIPNRGGSRAILIRQFL